MGDVQLRLAGLWFSTSFGSLFQEFFSIDVLLWDLLSTYFAILAHPNILVLKLLLEVIHALLIIFYLFDTVFRIFKEIFALFDLNIFGNSKVSFQVKTSSSPSLS